MHTITCTHLACLLKAQISSCMTTVNSVPTKIVDGIAVFRTITFVEREKCPGLFGGYWNAKMAICVPRGETFRSGSLSSCFKNGLILFSKFVGPIDTDVSRRTMISFTHLSGTRIQNIYDERLFGVLPVSLHIYCDRSCIRLSEIHTTTVAIVPVLLR